MGLTLHRAQPAKQVLHALHVRFKSRNALPRLSINLTIVLFASGLDFHHCPCSSLYACSHRSCFNVS